MTSEEAPDDRAALLELVGLRRRFGPVIALDGLTFGVPPGEVFGFLGPNGAGKTTAMRAIFGVVALDAGEVRWRGEPVGEQTRRRFGYMPEERGLYPNMPVLEQLEYFGRLHDMTAASARDAARDWIKRLGLDGRESARLEALSHGNQQRVQLAAALVHDPELLVLDEPFAGLDPGGVDDMTEILAERARAGVTVMFSSHQLDLVEHICESVAIIHRGRVVAQGRVSELERGERRPGIVITGAVFLVLGYAFYCTVYAAAGSLVSRQSDVGTVVAPVQIPLILAYVLAFTVIYANGANAFYRVLGFLPPTAPVAMPVLYAAGDVPAWQVAVSAALCAAGTVWMARVAALIYGRSILRTGSRVRLRQVLGSQPAA